MAQHKMPKTVSWGEYEPWMWDRLKQEQIVLPDEVEEFIKRFWLPEAWEAARKDAIGSSRTFLPREWIMMHEIEEKASRRNYPKTQGWTRVRWGSWTPTLQILMMMNFARIRKGMTPLVLMADDSQMTQFYSPWSDSAIEDFSPEEKEKMSATLSEGWSWREEGRLRSRLLSTLRQTLQDSMNSISPEQNK